MGNEVGFLEKVSTREKEKRACLWLRKKSELPIPPAAQHQAALRPP
jgi:hypothetical protein